MTFKDKVVVVTGGAQGESGFFPPHRQPLQPWMFILSMSSGFPHVTFRLTRRFTFYT